MSNKPHISAQKRARERIRQERYKLKQLRREEAKRRKAQEKDHRRRHRSHNGSADQERQDPDIAGIRPGPQSLPEQWEPWADVQRH